MQTTCSHNKIANEVCGKACITNSSIYQTIGDEDAIRRPEEVEQDMHDLRDFEEISEISPVGIYIPTLSVWPSGTTRWHRDAESQVVTATRCDQRGQIGCTEMENLDQLSELGVTEVDDLVIPKCTKRFWKFKSMTNRGLRVLLTQSVRIWLDQTLWCSMNRVWDEKSINS